MRSVQDIGDELYTLPPSAFTDARDTHIASAKQAGDRATSAELSAMKRPSVSAWLVNLVALRRPASINRLLEIGEEIRAAQGSVPAAQLRDLSAQRRAALDDALVLAQSLAAESGGAAPSRAHLQEAESTLAAAMADDSSAALVRSGRVLRPISYSGFGGVAMVGPARTAPSRTTPSRTAAHRTAAVDAESDAASQAAAQQRVAAQANLDRARDLHDEAVRVERAALASGEELAAQIAHLREELDAAQREARSAREARIAAERELASAQRRLDRLP